MAYQAIIMYSKSALRFVIIGIDIGFERKRNLSVESLNEVLQLELRSSEAEKKHTLTLSSSFFILLKSSMPFSVKEI
jgi:hypothetical protein